MNPIADPGTCNGNVSTYIDSIQTHTALEDR